MHEYNAGCLGVERVCALCEIQTRWKPNSPPRPPCGPSCLPNQMISLILIFEFLCRSSSWWPWPHIGGGRLFWPLLRPQMIVFDQFFCKICFVWVWRRKAFFLVSCRSLLWALGTVCQKGGGFSKKEGGFYALEYFSNVILRDKLAVK